MKFLIFLICLLLCNTLIYAQNNSLVETAVLDLIPTNIDSSDASILSERLGYEIFQLNIYTLLERELIKEILTEQGFQQSGCTSDDCIVEVGKLIGVRQIVGGSVSKLGSTYTVTIRLIDVETGKIIKSSVYDHKGEIDILLDEGMQILAQSLIPQSTQANSQPISTTQHINNTDTLTAPKNLPLFYFQIAILYPIQIIPQEVEIHGLKINALWGKNRAIKGLDVGLINHITDKTIGLQAGAINISNTMYGLQVSAYNNAHEVRGAQLGVFNSSKKVIGIQIGLINSTDDLVGIQIGLLNFAHNREFLSMVPILNIGF